MIDIAVWTKEFLQAVNHCFGPRLWFAGLQGSYGRDEAGETSDIDMVVILDELGPADIQSYNELLDRLPHRERICGFLSGKQHLLHWDPSELFQFYYDTTPLQGSLDELLPLIDTEAVRRAIKCSAGGIFHGCVHNMLFDKSEEILKDLYKSACFAVQAIHFLRTGQHIRRHADLPGLVGAAEEEIVNTCLELKKGGAADFDKMSEALFLWSGSWIEKTDL